MYCCRVWGRAMASDFPLREEPSWTRRWRSAISHGQQQNQHEETLLWLIRWAVPKCRSSEGQAAIG